MPRVYLVLFGFRYVTGLHKRFIFNCDRLRFEALLLLALPGEKKRIRIGGPAFCDCRDHICAAQPMRLGKIGCGPLRRVIGMGVVETRNFRSLLPRLSLNVNEFQGSYVIAVMSRIGSRISGTHRFYHSPSAGNGLPKQRSTALVRICFLSMGTNSFIQSARQEEGAQYSSQKRSLRYLSAESGSTVTMVARRPSVASALAIRSEATTAAAAEMPTMIPSSRARRLTIA